MGGLEQAYPGKVTARTVDATTPEGRAAAKEFGWKSHGLAIRATGGEALWSQPDHKVRIEDVREALSRTLAP